MHGGIAECYGVAGVQKNVRLEGYVVAGRACFQITHHIRVAFTDKRFCTGELYEHFRRARVVVVTVRVNYILNISRIESELPDMI
jgi:hypothetical protein